MKNIIIYILFVWVSLGCLKGQDPQFTQFYASPKYLNPAFVGTTEDLRISTIYRNQWSKLPRAYNTGNVSIDHNIPDLHSGVGLSFTADRQGVSNYKLNDLAFAYSYGLEIHKKWAIRTGLQFGWTQRGLNEDELRFGNQLDAEVGYTGASSGEFSDLPNINYLSIASGVMAYSKRMWVGAAVHNINRPNQSFLIGNESLVPLRLSVHGMAKFEIVKGQFTNNKKVYYLVPAFNYRLQGEYDQLDIGFDINYQPIVFGVWYRGIPIAKRINGEYFDQDALALLIGYHYQDFMTFAYSYDLTISSLGPGSGGSHEVSVSIDIVYPHSNKPKYEKFLPCPKF